MESEEEKKIEMKVSSLLEVIGKNIVRVIGDERITVQDSDTFIGEIRLEVRKILSEETTPNFKSIDDNFEKIRNHISTEFNSTRKEMNSRFSSVDSSLMEMKEFLKKIHGNIRND